jgi:hypothetical protein
VRVVLTHRALEKNNNNNKKQETKRETTALQKISL